MTFTYKKAMQMVLRKKGFLLWVFFFLSSNAHALTNAQTFTYQGRLMNAAGTAALNDHVNLTFGIYDPNGTCLLYEETQSSIDLTTSDGVFAVQVGSAVGPGKRTSNDSGLAMAAIFSNSGTLVGNGGCSYSPAAGQNRRLKVTVTPQATGVPVTLSPDQAINSVPQAQTAETLQGLSPVDIIQAATGVTGQNNVSLATLKTLTGAGDASSLHNHDSLYVKLGASSSTNLGSNGAYTGGNFGIGIATPTVDLDFGGATSRVIQVDRNTSAAAGNTLTVAAGGAQTGASNQSGGTLVLSGGIATGNGGSDISFKTSSGGGSGSSDSSPTTKMVLTSGGKLGVNALSPAAQLEVHSSGTSVVGSLIKAISGQVADLFQVQDNSGAVLTKIDSSGFLTLPGAPTTNNMAATKAYVDTAVAGASGGVSSFNTRTGAITLSSGDVTTALTYTPLKNSSDFMSGTLGVGASVSANTQFQSTSTAATSITAILKGASSQSADLLQFQDNTGAILSKVNKDGVITLASDPTASLQAATKQYVDTAVAAVPAGVTSFNTRTGAITLSTGDVTTALTYTPVNKSGDTMSGALNLPSNGLVVGTNQLAVSGGFVGIGTASPVTMLDVRGDLQFGASANTGRIKSNGVDTFLDAIPVSSSIIFRNNGATEKMRIDSNGNVGIGASTLTAKFEVDTGAAATVGQIVKGFTSQSGDLTQYQNSSGSVLSKFDSAGYLTLPGIPTATNMAATKGYVDSAITGAAGVASFNTRTGAVSLSSSDVTTALTYTPVNKAGDTMSGALNLPANGLVVNTTDLVVSNSKLGLGTASPGAQLDVRSAAAANVGQIIKGAASQSGDLFQLQDSSSSVLTKFDSAGYLTLPGVPTSSMQAATKGYVDSAITGAAGVSTFNTRSGAVTLSSSDVTTALTYTPVNKAGDTMSGALNLPANGLAVGTSQFAVSGGMVGIGTASPTALLEMKSATATRPSLLLNNTSASNNSNSVIFQGPNASYSLYEWSDGSNFAFDSSLNGGHLLRLWGATGNASIETGSLGVGTTAPGSRVEVDTSSATNIGHIVKGFASQSADLAQYQNSSGSVLSKFDAAGYLTLPGVPTTTNMAATKGYVDSAITGAAGVSTFNTRSGAVTLSSSDVTTALTYTPVNKAGDTMTGALALPSNGLTVGTTDLIVSSSKVGVGIAVPTANLHVNSTAAAGIVQVNRGVASQTGDLVQYQNNSGSVLSKIDSSGFLTLPGVPTTTNMAATKGYVDSAITAAAGVSTFNTRSGAVTLSLSDVTTALTYTPVNKAGDTMSGALNLPANGLVVNTTDLVVSSGKIGVGTASPGAQLDIRSAAAANVGQVIKGAASQSGDLIQLQNSSATVLSKFDSSGFLTLPGVPTTTNMAATKGYVDTAISGVSGVGGSGSSGYLSKFTAATTLGNTGVFDDGAGKVGFGTSSPSANVDVRSSAAATIAQVIRGYTSQSADLLQLQNTSATVLAKFSSAGALTLPASGLLVGTTDLSVSSNKVGVGIATATSQLHVVSGAAATVGQIIKAASSQTGDLMQFQNSSGTVLSKFDSAGMLTLAGAPTASLHAATKSYVDTSVTGIISGTASYVPKFATSTTLGNSALYSSSTGNIGIGTTTPGAAGVLVTSAKVLDIVGGSSQDAYLRVLGGSGGTKGGLLIGNDDGSNRSYGQFTFDNSNNTFTLNQMYNSGYLGLGANSRSTDLTIAASNGFVGLNTSSAQFPLEVVNTNATGTVVARNTAAGGVAAIAAYNDANSQGHSATFGYSSATAGQFLVGGPSGEMGFQGNAGNYPFVFYTNATQRMTITGTGSVGIGTISPSYTLQVNGSVAGTSAYNNTSDGRLKTAIQPLVSSMSRLEKINGVTFKWKDPVKMQSDRQQIGFIAQDVEKVFPEAVTHQNDGFMSVAYSMLIPPVVEALKEMNAKVVSLFDRAEKQDRQLASIQDHAAQKDLEIAALKTKNHELEQRLLRLEQKWNQK